VKGIRKRAKGEGAHFSFSGLENESSTFVIVFYLSVIEVYLCENVFYLSDRSLPE
jgi:hypothetical protein